MKRIERADRHDTAEKLGDKGRVISETRKAIRVAVVGAGAWGTALSIHAAKLGHDVSIWAREKKVTKAIREKHKNPFLPGIRLPDSIHASCDLEEVLDEADLAIFTTPAQHLREISSRSADFIGKKTIVVVASKGIEKETLKLQSQVLEETLPRVTERLAFLSGPTFAREVALGLPASLVSASRNPDTNLAVQQALHDDNFRIYDSNDTIGVQLGGDLKNVIAIAAGICDGLKMGNNARAALITRGLGEITRLGVKLGANPMTFIGLSGHGDLNLTCTGEQSRNRALGLSIAEGVDSEVYVKEHCSVAEGYYTAKAAWGLAQREGVRAPIIKQVHNILYEGLSVRDAVRLIMNGGPRNELEGITE